VIVRADGGSRASLTAYFATADGKHGDGALLLQRLRSALPDYLVPAQCVRLDELPRTPDGAIDSAALAAMPPAGQALVEEAGQQKTGRSVLAASLASIWAEEFSVPAVRDDDDFFALGGNSLLALHLLARIEDEFDLTLPLQALFEASTVGELAGLLERSLAEGEADGTAGDGLDAG
jgi:acyl carrier protein